jgi:kumamolisin
MGHAGENIELTFRLQERVPMEVLAQNVLDPASPRYRKYYTPDEIRQVAAPSDADYQALLSTLRGQGFSVVSESPSHLIVTVSASQALVEKQFATSFKFDKTSGRHSIAKPYQIPAALSLIASVSGLDTTRKTQPKFKRPRATPASRTDSGPQGNGLMPEYIFQVYDFNPVFQAGWSGKGQDIAIAGYDKYNPLDLTWYYGTMLNGNGPDVDEVIFNGEPGPDPDSLAENDLDAEFIGLMAPHARIHYFLSAHNDDPGEVQLFTAILDDNRAKLANYSWGDCEADITPQHFSDMDKIFNRAVAQGVTIVAASGDSGSAGCPDSKGGAVSADWPSAHPAVMSGGGTTLYTTGIFNPVLHEDAWESTGGGISVVWKAPDWQKSISPNGMRVFPDVSFNADPNTGEPAYLTYPALPDWMQIGGTSIAAPQWVGFLATVNEARGAAGPMGFVPPYIYGLSADQRAKAFRDITAGSNGAYKAMPGWDMTTGWGSLDAFQLLGMLKSL